MVLSKRERYIAIGVGIAVAAAALDQLLIAPFVDRQRKISAGTDKVKEDLQNGVDSIDRQKRLTRDWAKMAAGGLKTARTDAESQAQNGVREWCQDSGVAITTFSSSRVSPEGKFEVISFHVTGSGRMRDVMRLTWAMESSPIPLRISDLQLTPHKEGKDDLRVEFTVSTISEIPGEAVKPAPKPAVSMVDFGGMR